MLKPIKTNTLGVILQPKASTATLTDKFTNDTTGEELTRTKEVITTSSSAYSRVHPLLGKTIMPLNIFQITRGMPTRQSDFFLDLLSSVTEREFKAIAFTFNISNLPKNQQPNKYKSYKELYKKNLVKRVDKDYIFPAKDYEKNATTGVKEIVNVVVEVKKGQYMINPELILPYSYFKEISEFIWSKL